MKRGAGWALWWVGGICYWQGDYESARSYYRQVLPLREANGRSNDVAFIRRRLGQLCLWLEDNKAAQQYYMAALEASRQRNKMWDEGYLLNSLGDCLARLRRIGMFALFDSYGIRRHPRRCAPPRKLVGESPVLFLVSDLKRLVGDR